MVLPFGIERSTFAGGLTSVAAFAIGLGLTALGIPNGGQLALGLATIIVPIVVHFVPDAAKIDAGIKEVAKVIPQTYSTPGDYPDVPPQTVSQGQQNANINKQP